MTLTDVAFIVALVLFTVGGWRVVQTSERHSRGVGPLGGTLRPITKEGLRAGLPFYGPGALILLAVAFK